MSEGRRQIRVLVVDDEPMVCAHLTTILGSVDDLTVVDQAHDGAAAITAVLRHRPDVVLIDLRMPVMDGLTAIERISAQREPPVLVALTTFDADHFITRALRAGAVGFLLKSTPPADLIDLVRVAAAGHTVLSPVVTKRLLAVRGADGGVDHRLALIDRLTKREREVLRCLGEGLSNAQIGTRLFLAEATVKGYVSRLLVKLECANRTQAGLLAKQTGV